MNDSKNEAESVCVIGAGVSGTVVVKELKQARVSVEAFEMMPIVGGGIRKLLLEGRSTDVIIYFHLVFRLSD